jgi:phytoene dehydrogenase-like protein
LEYDGQNLYAKPISARKVVSSIVSDPLLVDMISCPLMFCGNAQENDIQFGQFVIMFKSIFCEGLARPQAGIRQILDVLVKKYKACGGELKMKCAMTSLKCANDRVESILLENGEVLTADKILSSAGYVETMKLLTDYYYSQFNCSAGQLSFVESILVSNKEPAEIGYTTTSTFYNNSD